MLYDIGAVALRNQNLSEAAEQRIRPGVKAAFCFENDNGTYIEDEPERSPLRARVQGPWWSRRGFRKFSVRFYFLTLPTAVGILSRNHVVVRGRPALASNGQKERFLNGW